MQKNDIIRKNPLTLMGYEKEDILNPGDFGALMARAGVGKTAFLVQLSLDKMLRNRNVLHISLSEPVEKVCLWYEEVFRNLTFQSNIKYLDPFWDAILPSRFIMTFKAEAFSVTRLQERLTDLTEQGIFFPRLIVIDGLRFGDNVGTTLSGLKQLAKDLGTGIWFTMGIHRDEPFGPDGFPQSLSYAAPFFDVVLQLHPEGKNIYVRAVKGAPQGGKPELVLDPATLLIRDSEGN
ncbi:MAG: cytoplasmic protein [Desulfococcaceae bacterium]